MPQFESWLKLYSSKRLDIRIRAARGILDHADSAPLDLLIDILCSLAHQGLGAATQKALLKRNDSDLVTRMIATLTKSLWYFEQAGLHPEVASTGATREPSSR